MIEIPLWIFIPVTLVLLVIFVCLLNTIGWLISGDSWAKIKDFWVDFGGWKLLLGASFLSFIIGIIICLFIYFPLNITLIK